MPATLQLNLTGGANNADPNLSLGGAHSANALSSTALNNLFDDVAPDEASAGDVEYRAIDVTNVGNATAVGVKAFMNPETGSADTILDFGIEQASIDVTTSIADESTAPVDPGTNAAVTFAHYNATTKLALPDIPAGSYCRVWVRRTVAAGAANTSNDQGTINVEYA